MLIQQPFDGRSKARVQTWCIPLPLYHALTNCGGLARRPGPFCFPENWFPRGASADRWSQVIYHAAYLLFLVPRKVLTISSNDTMAKANEVFSFPHRMKHHVAKTPRIGECTRIPRSGLRIRPSRPWLDFPDCSAIESVAPNMLTSRECERRILLDSPSNRFKADESGREAESECREGERQRVNDN